MREIRSSGSVEGVVRNRDPYSDSFRYQLTAQRQNLKLNLPTSSPESCWRRG